MGDGYHLHSDEKGVCLPLAVVLDWASRRVLAWRLSISLAADAAVEALEEAIATHGVPEIMNTDQGSQFTASAFIDVLRRHAVRISMDGKGCWRDNVFVERLWKSVEYGTVYLHAYDHVATAPNWPSISTSTTGAGRIPVLDRQAPDDVYFNLPPLQLAA